MHLAAIKSHWSQQLFFRESDCNSWEASNCMRGCKVRVASWGVEEPSWISVCGGRLDRYNCCPALMLASSFARSVESASCVLSRPPPTPFFWWFGGRLGRVLVRVVGGFHSPVVRFVYEMLVCAISPFRVDWISFPLWWFQHLDACERGCGVMVHAESDVSNCLSIVDFEV